MNFTQKAVARLESLNISYQVIDHPAVFTVEDSLEHMGNRTPVKNLLLSDRSNKRYILVVMAGEKRLDAKIVAQTVGSTRLAFAKPELLLKVLGVTPGAASILSLMHNGASSVEVVLDIELLHAKELGFHPNDNTKTLVIAGNDVKKFVQNAGNRYFVANLY